MKLIVGVWGGAVLAALLCVAYDTSANVSALEGGQHHLTYRQVLGFTGGGALAGLLLAAVLLAVSTSVRTVRASIRVKQLGDP